MKIHLSQDLIWLGKSKLPKNQRRSVVGFVILKNMEYIAKDFSHLLGNGKLSDELLTAHFGLYEGYVANVNKAITLLQTLEVGTLEWAEVKRRFGWEFNGMRLHELYFEGMTAEETQFSEGSALLEQLKKSYGSGESAHTDFLKTAAMRGVGWVVMAYDRHADRIFNTWIGEHEIGHLAGAEPLVVMDCWEHAYIKDFGTKRPDYIDAFVKMIDWQKAEERFDRVSK